MNDESLSVAHHPSINAAVDLLKQGETAYRLSINFLYYIFHLDVADDALFMYFFCSFSNG